MRRKDRELSETDALEIIDKCSYAVISCTDGDEIFSIPISIVRENDRIYIHGAPAGGKERLFKDGKKVTLVCAIDVKVPCFSDDEVRDAVANNKASNVFTTEYKSAIAVTKAYRITDEARAIHALKILSQKYTPKYMHAFDAAIAQSLTRTNVYELVIVSVSAKAKIII